ncbi:NACHT domain-containing protein [Kitasatospora sp. NPDC007106]|uniref:NACHT domain-containing protein n=1 Tax=Kitasatospora sp. NPDC007106 TaxID=3156914 RepID=UPI0033F35A45
MNEYPGVQCFPVGMADGGRDATARSSGHSDIVFQVKFTAKPASIRDPFKWIAESIDGELEKIERLKDRGFTKYFLITNLPPSANLDTGTIDKVDRYLRENVPIEAQCWWRDDLDRRLDTNYDLKLRYPSLLSGTDLLRLVVERMGPEESRRRRQRALISYFAHQFERDSSIRFKQAHLLPSSLFDLFVDVPLAPMLGPDNGHEGVAAHYAHAVNRRLHQEESTSRVHVVSSADVYNAARVDAAERLPRRYHAYSTGRYPLMGGADLLLDADFSDTFPQIVLEGAPGQGKSTLAQYIAQVHRARLLQREDINLPPAHSSSAVLMPFKIELRDLASWLNGFDPWSGKSDTLHDGKKSLEGALAAHVERYSGGLDFSVSDLAFLVEEYPVFIILDALDEVADLEDRSKVVEEVSAAIVRLNQNSRRVRVLITSRPTAVSNAPSFSHQRFQYLKLAAITPDIALNYTDRWGQARNLAASDIAEIRDILSQKMSAPHMAELAKNTMQLSILLSLILHKGPSLPDKRTELYDSYVESYFNREVEKSSIVREHRNLLISIHQHLAFYIHARAEGRGTTGRIDRDELQAVVRSRLRELRQPEALLDDLLTGMDRIVALVSRVEGTYEFEVQPLREYFAARYLYDTAPYISATQSASGTKPDRFDGIAPNSYWLNVTRFFAGCFTMGELLDLAERVAILCGKPEFRGMNYPRVLALALLQDWVFFQSVPATERLLDSLFDKPGIRWAERRARSYIMADSSDLNLFLVDKAGGSYVVEKMWKILGSDPFSERARAACAVIMAQKANTSINVEGRWLQDFLRKDPGDRRPWIKIGGWLDVFPAIGIADLGADDEFLMPLIPDLVAAGAYFEAASEILRRQASLYVLSDPLTATSDGFVGTLSFMVNPTVWSMFTEGDSPPIINYLTSRLHDVKDFPSSNSASVAATVSLSSLMEESFSSSGGAKELSHWKEFCRLLDESFGESWASYCIGITAGAVRSQKERGAGADRLFDPAFPFIDRVRNAKRRGKQDAWWLAQLDAAASELERTVWLATMFTWAEAEVIMQLRGSIASAVDSISVDHFDVLLQFTQVSRRFSSRAQKILPSNLHSRDAWKNGSRMVVLFFDRVEPCVEKDALALNSGKFEDDPVLARLLIQYAWERFSVDAISEQDFLSVIDRKYGPGVFFPVRPRFDAKVLKMSRSLAEQVMERAWDMPSNLLTSAENNFARRRGHVRPVLRIAEEQKWF